MVASLPAMTVLASLSALFASASRASTPVSSEMRESTSLTSFFSCMPSEAITALYSGDNVFSSFMGL